MFPSRTTRSNEVPPWNNVRVVAVPFSWNLISLGVRIEFGVDFEMTVISVVCEAVELHACRDALKPLLL